jgi:hypothetical protein
MYLNHIRRWSVTTAFLTALLAVPCTWAQESDPKQESDSKVEAPAEPTTHAIQPGTPAQPGTAVQPEAPTQDKRAFGVFPNYRTTEISLPYSPLTAKQKLTIATKDAFDYPGLIMAGFFAGVYQWMGVDNTFGQGVEGYLKRYGAAVADQIIGTELSEGVIPALCHHDPRYFRLGPEHGTKGARTRYALTRVLITRTDAGRKTINVGELGGTATAVAISNLYYPDSHTLADNVEKFGIQVGTDAMGNMLKEFWPDVKQWYAKRHSK